MSINHYSSEPHWWSHYTMEAPAKNPSDNRKEFISHLRQDSTAAMFSLNNGDGELLLDEEKLKIERENGKLYNKTVNKEPLFEKPLTPSDVGKLNRLVIPKQHAEKYFPLSSAGVGGDSGEKGFLLGFEDELGKSWRFRYSYWNSSQSYVLTKGWSRFVKEKRLDAGDFVLFLRHREDAGRFFIGWRRRKSGQDCGGAPAGEAVGSGGDIWNRVFYSSSGNAYPSQGYEGSPSQPYQPECLHAGSVLPSQTPTPTPTSSGNSKRLRLFGVNLECEVEPEGSPMSSQGQAHIYPDQQHYSNGHNHTGMYFSGGDVYRRI